MVGAPVPSMPRWSPPRSADWARALLAQFEEGAPEPRSRVGAYLESIRLPAVMVTATVLIVAVSRPAQGSRESRGDWVRRWLGRVLYAASVINPFFSVIADDYTFVRDAASSYLIKRRRRKQTPLHEQEEALRRLVTGVGKVHPRRLFAAGATLRGVQLHSPLVRCFDPPSTFGLGLNMLALLDGVAWPASFTLGWAITKPWWLLTGDPARGAGTAVPVPSPSTDSAVLDAMEERAVPRRRCALPGLSLTLRVPPTHLTGLLIGLMVRLDKWRWVLVMLVGSVRWSPDAL